MLLLGRCVVGFFSLVFEGDTLKAACADHRGKETAKVELGAVNRDVGQEETSRVVGRGDFGHISSHVEVVEDGFWEGWERRY